MGPGVLGQVSQGCWDVVVGWGMPGQGDMLVWCQDGAVDQVVLGQAVGSRGAGL